jgi:dCMP deaminase
MQHKVPLLGHRWLVKFRNVAVLVATWSKDQSVGIGCVIVGPDHEIRSTGYNGFPRDIDDTVAERHVRPAKYLWTEHAERNAIYNAARVGLSTKNCIAILTCGAPCADCARAFIQAGIEAVYGLNVEGHCALTRQGGAAQWSETCFVGAQMLKEAGVDYFDLTDPGCAEVSSSPVEQCRPERTP